MKFAVVEINDKQHLLKEGHVVTIDGNHDESKLTFDKLMLASDENQAVNIGQPYITGGTVEAEVLASGKREKDIVFKFKRKTGYKLTKGHRQNSTTIRITKITLPSASNAQPKTKAATTKSETEGLDESKTQIKENASKPKKTESKKDIAPSKLKTKEASLSTEPNELTKGENHGS
jgi:large subunit ribosomal protein L21